MIALIAAIQKSDRGLGSKNELLYRISADLKRFRALTTGNVIIVGRKTFESIGRTLPDRHNIVITRNSDFTPPEGVIVAHSLDEALAKARESGTAIFIIGGAEIYRQSINIADRLYLTIIDDHKEADVFFPDYSDFKKVISEEKLIDEKTGVPYSYVVLEK
ncbi:MAG: dihydrofolate reductase [Candidatus Pacebacteria bacterium]|jgi:dihydrofolate reductase|nr:dihydrofolate reductase [Candidatus Paceibacterota bacterium]